MKMFAVPGYNHYGHRSGHMEGWTDIGVGIKLIKAGEKPREDIVSLKSQRAKLLTVWEKYVDHHRQRIGHNDEFHQFFEGFHIKKQGVEMNPNQEYKPKDVRNQKIFAKGDHIIQRAMDGRIIFPDP